MSSHKMPTVFNVITLFSPLLGTMLMIVLVTTISVSLLDARIHEAPYEEKKDNATLIDINRIPIEESTSNASLCPRKLLKCPANQDFRKLCFNCDEGLEYMCVDSTIYNFGMEICVNKHQEFEKGIQIVAIYRPQYRSVYMREEQCPPGTYKPERAPVYVSCAEHNPPPPHFIIHTQGTTTTPPRGYCDWRQGYFNLNHQTFWYTNETFLCSHRSEHTYVCTANLDVLPDGTCSQRCVGGERDPDNMFMCTNRFLPTLTDTLRMTFAATNIPSATQAVVTKLASQNNPKYDEPVNNTPIIYHISVGLGIGLGIAGVVGVIVVVVLVVVLVKHNYPCKRREEFCNPNYRPFFSQNSNMNQNGSDKNNEKSIQTDPDIPDRDATTNNTTHIHYRIGGNALTFNGNCGTASISSKVTNGPNEPMNETMQPLADDSISVPLMSELKNDEDENLLEEANIESSYKIDSGLGTTANRSDDETCVLKIY